MQPSFQIKQNNVLASLRNKLIQMDKVVVKATEIFCQVDAIFKASDGNMYYIDGGRSTIAEELFGDWREGIYHLTAENMLQWINDNPKRWERDEA